MRVAVIAAVIGCLALPVAAQDSRADRSDAEWMAWVPSEGELEMPAVSFSSDAAAAANFDRFFVFHRQDTDFPTALADIRECDSFARGLTHREVYASNAAVAAYTRLTPLYGLAGALGDPVAGSIANAIYGSAEIRRKQRVNMRRCMFFKGYSRFGLTEGVWNDFNFSDSDDEIAERDRQRMLALQALVASGPRPAAADLGL